MRAVRPSLERFRAPALFAALFVGTAFVLRIALLVRMWHEVRPGPALLARIFAAGLVFDAAAACFAVAPFLLWTAVTPARWQRTPLARAAWHGVFLAALVVVLFATVAEWLFFAEFGARFNFIAVDYLVYTRELALNAWESYPIPLLLAVIALGALALWWPLRRALARSFAAPATLAARAAAVALACGSVALAFGAVDARSANVSSNRYGQELAKNGLWELFSAFRNSQLDFVPFYRSEDETVALRRAHELVAAPGAAFVSDDPAELVRQVAPAGPERRWNVVLVVVESLSADFLGSYGHSKLTPHLDALAAQGVRFTQLYATGTRTVRGLEAVSLSIPPTPGESIVKRAANGGLFHVGSPFLARGYDVRFLYGGFGFFDNMNAFFGGNGFQVIDRASFARDEITFANAWGVADEDLFHRALREADDSAGAGRPFFSLLMTTSNHRPYTYPAGRVAIQPQSGRDGAVQYTDWAIGDFVAQAALRPWFANTLFVFVADHCASSSGKTEIPVRKYRIPLILYAPGLLRPATIDTLASQIDVAPTLLGLLGFHYRSHFFGRDLFAPSSGTPRALLSTYQQLGLLQNGILTVLSPGRRVEAFRVDIARRRQTAAPPDPAALADTIAYYQAASWAWTRGVLRDAGSAPGDAAR